MSILKSLLQRLLETRTTSEEAGHSAMPSFSSINVSPVTTGETQTYVAPADGYLSATVDSTQDHNSFINMWGSASILTVGSATSYGQTKAFIPVSKGTSCAFHLRGENPSVTFIKTIGGGILDLLSRLFVREVRYVA